MSEYTVQKVSGAIRKAGLPRASWLASGRVRGWGDWSSGVRVRLNKYDGLIRVDYMRGRWSKATTEDDQHQCARISEALKASGIEHTLSRDETVCIVRARP